ncbi:MAG: PadR family transcriptional regulator [Cyanobacteria bacterium P01_H01_bin.121]
MHPCLAQGLSLVWAGGYRERHAFASDRVEQRGRSGGKSRGRAGHKFGEKGWGERPRRRRGDIKFILLSLIAERPQHGYELIKELEQRRGGFRRLSPGSVYPTLQMLAEGGYLTSEQIEGKRVYTITDSGQQLLQEHQAQVGSGAAAADSPGPAPAEPASELVQLRQALTTLNEAVAQLAQIGSPEQIKQGYDRLEQVRREIYALLAQ